MSHQDLPAVIVKGRSLMVELPNLVCVEVAQPVASLRGPLANNQRFEPVLTLALFFFPCFNMTQLNNVEGDYNTDIDYGTVDGAQTQSPFATSGPYEVISFFIVIYFQ